MRCSHDSSGTCTPARPCKVCKTPKPAAQPLPKPPPKVASFASNVARRPALQNSSPMPVVSSTLPLQEENEGRSTKQGRRRPDKPKTPPSRPARTPMPEPRQPLARPPPPSPSRTPDYEKQRQKKKRRELGDSLRWDPQNPCRFFLEIEQPQCGHEVCAPSGVCAARALLSLSAESREIAPAATELLSLAGPGPTGPGPPPHGGPGPPSAPPGTGLKFFKTFFIF